MGIVEIIAAGISLTLIHVCRLLGVAFVAKVSLEQLTELVKATRADIKMAMQEQERWNIRIPPPPRKSEQKNREESGQNGT